MIYENILSLPQIYIGRYSPAHFGNAISFSIKLNLLTEFLRQEAWRGFEKIVWSLFGALLHIQQLQLGKPTK